MNARPGNPLAPVPAPAGSSRREGRLATLELRDGPAPSCESAATERRTPATPTPEADHYEFSEKINPGGRSPPAFRRTNEISESGRSLSYLIVAAFAALVIVCRGV